MNIQILKTYDEISQYAGDIIADIVSKKPDAILGLATGSTPLGVYKYLIDQKLDFKKVTTFNLDEYVGLEKTDPQSYHYYMKEHFFDHINIDPANTNIPNGKAKNPEIEAAEFDAKIVALGGVDVQILGIGENGHIGFNEPAEDFKIHTFVTDLATSTINANSRYFEKIEDVPTRAITMGIGTIMRAKKIILIANGPKKAEAIASVLNKNVHPQTQASILNFHPDVTVLLDEAAASLVS